MTTKVRIEPAGHHVLVETVDVYEGQTHVGRQLMQPRFNYVEGQQVDTGQGPLELYATTTRTIRVVDLEPTDPRIAELTFPNQKPE
jgi:hypothetical protein